MNKIVTMECVGACFSILTCCIEKASEEAEQIKRHNDEREMLERERQLCDQVDRLRKDFTKILRSRPIKSQPTSSHSSSPSSEVDNSLKHPKHRSHMNHRPKHHQSESKFHTVDNVDDLTPNNKTASSAKVHSDSTKTKDEFSKRINKRSHSLEAMDIHISFKHDS